MHVNGTAPAPLAAGRKWRVKMKRLIPVAAMCSFAISYAQSPTRDLFEALRQGDAAKVQASVNQGADVNSRDELGNTLLMQAALYSTLALMQFLLERGADPKGANERGYNALMRSMPDLVKTKLLLERGADVNAASVEGLTPVLIAAAIPTATETLRYLLQKGADPRATLSAQPRRRCGDAGRGTGSIRQSQTPPGRWSGWSCRSKSCAPYPVPNRTRPRTPWSAPREDREPAKAPRVDGCRYFRMRCLCTSTYRSGARKSLPEPESGITALHNAAFEGNPATVKQLVDAGAEVNATDERGFTPLMMAVSSRTGNAEVPRLLLARGANAAAKDNMGRTVADWSRIGARAEILKLMHVAPGAVMVNLLVTEPAARDIRATVQKSVNLLQATAPNFFRSTGCISCHNVSIPMMALTEARRRGYSADPAPSQKMTKRARRAARSAPR